MNDEVTTQARAVVNAGHNLVQALTDALSDDARDKLQMLATAGAAVALTVRWIDGRAEVRVGVTMDDSPAETILAMDFGASASSH